LNQPEYPITATKAVVREKQQCAAVLSLPPSLILHVREKQEEGRNDTLALKSTSTTRHINTVYFFFNVSNRMVAIPLDPFRYEPPTPSSFSLYFDVLANVENVKVK